MFTPRYPWPRMPGALAGLLIASASLCSAQSEAPREYDVKAAFLINFTNYVEWPSKYAAPDGTLTICVLGRDRFGRALDDIAVRKSAPGRALGVRRISDLRHVDGCHVLFVGPSEHHTAEQLAMPGVLTVGEEGSPGAENLAIRFVMEDRKVRFLINTEAAERGNLHISARLLGLAAMEKH